MIISMTRMVSAIAAAVVTALLFLVAAYAAVYLPPYVHQYGNWIEPVYIIALVTSLPFFRRPAACSRIEWMRQGNCRLR